MPGKNYPFSQNINQASNTSSNNNKLVTLNSSDLCNTSSNNNKLVTLNSSDLLEESAIFQKVGNHVKKLKKESQHIMDEISDTVENETKKEKQELEVALNNYQNKVTSILGRDDIKSKKEKGEKYGKQLTKVMEQIRKAYISSIKEIKGKCKDQSEFMKKVAELDKRIENVLLTDEEKVMMEKIRNEIVSMFDGDQSAGAEIKYLPF